MKKHAGTIVKLALAGLFVALWIAHRGRLASLDVRALIETTDSEPLAFLVILFLFALRSVFFILPEPVLFITISIIYRPGTALLLSLAGVTASLLTGYAAGRYGRAELVEKRLSKMRRTLSLPSGSPPMRPLHIFFLRFTPLIPNQLVSILLGARRYPFSPYMRASFLGLLPRTVCCVLLGGSLADASAELFLAAGAIFLLSFCLGILYFILFAARPESLSGPRHTGDKGSVNHAAQHSAGAPLSMRRDAYTRTRRRHQRTDRTGAFRRAFVASHAAHAAPPPHRRRARRVSGA